MASTPLILVIVLNFVLSLYLLNRYGNLGKHNVWITTSVFIAWFFSFNVVFVLPLDVTSTIYNQCIVDAAAAANQNHSQPFSASLLVALSNSTTVGNLTTTTTTTTTTTSAPDVTPVEDVCKKPWSYVPKNVLLTLWQFIYWSSQVLTWILLPIFQSYSMSGEFTTFRKIKSSFIENIKYYCFFGVLFIIFLIYYASRESMSFEGLKVFCTSASNTFGLFLLTVLMGYGLVEIPRTFLSSTQNYKYKLDYLYFKIAKTNGEKCEADGNLDDLLDEIRALYIYASDRGHVFSGHLEKILRKCPESFQNEFINRHGRSVNSSSSQQEIEAKLTEKNLIKLNAKIKQAVQTSHRTKVQYTMLIQEGIQLKEAFESDTVRLSPLEVWLRQRVPKFEVLLRQKPLIVRVISFLTGWTLALFSVMIVWSEFTFFIQVIPVSLFSLVVRLLRYNYLWIEVFSMASIAYLCTCCYYTIFKIRIFNYYYLARHHQTDEYSLIFCGIMIHLDSHITKQSGEIQETAFTQIMGHMDTISFIGDHLFIYLPVLMSLFCVATFFKLGVKVVHYFGIEQFSISDEITQDLVLQGQNLVKRESQKISRGGGGGGGGGVHQVVSINAARPTTFGSGGHGPSPFTRQTSQEQLLTAGSPTSASTPEEKTYGVNKNLFDDI
ncbi:LMBR1 domain-containing protein 2 [Tyrophagus putrescentiae]|nr:LMBR1 domain-containing protein 2 [Tyrophagus putrescentiae]